MSDENALALVQSITALQAASKFTDDTFSEVGGTGANFLPRLQLFTSNSEQCKKGQIGVATYGLLIKDELTELGKDILAMPLAWRSKAMFVKSDPPVAYHNQASKEFQEIKEKAKADSNSGNLFGPEYLVWLGPQHGFATFYMASKTARNASGAVHALLPSDGKFKVGVFSSEYIETKDYGWHGPKCTLSTQTLELPPQAQMDAVVADFLNPRDSAKKEAAPTEAVNQDR